MAGPYSPPPTGPGRDEADLVRWRFTTVLLAVLPLISLGLLAVVSTAWLAIRRRTWRTRAAAVLVAAASVTEYVLISVYPSEPGPPTWAFSPLILLTWIGATTQFLIELTLWRRDVLPSRGRPAAYPTAPVHPAWQPYPAGPRGPEWTGPFAAPGYAGPPTRVPPPAPPVPPVSSAPAAPAAAPPPVRPTPSAPAGPPAGVRPRGPLDDDTIGVDLGAELRLLGAEFGHDAGAGADGGHDDGGRRPDPGGAR